VKKQSGNRGRQGKSEKVWKTQKEKEVKYREPPFKRKRGQKKSKKTSQGSMVPQGKRPHMKKRSDKKCDKNKGGENLEENREGKRPQAK